MAFLREADVLRRASASRFVAESLLKSQVDPTIEEYDVFLSHSVKDAKLVQGVKNTLEDLGISVYVDWIDDPQLDRSKVNRSTADTLRERMQRCKSLVYLHSPNAPYSKWMPWELGYFDGFNGNVAILPVVNTSDYEFKGQEYLGLYPTVDVALAEGGKGPYLWVNESKSRTMRFENWRDGKREWREVS